MSTQETQGPEREGNDQDDGTDTRTRLTRAVSAVTERGRNGSLAVLGGGLLVVRAARAATRKRAAIQALAGAALIGVGLRQRRGGDVTVPIGSTVTERLESNQPDTNPRDVSEEPDVETVTDPDEGTVEFTDDQNEEPRPKPDLDEEVPDDPRRDAADDDEPTEVDLSEASMADEASEATGPSTEQAYPASEGTDPEPTAPEAPSRTETDADTGDEEEVETGASETVETEGGATVDTDTVEAGTMDVDVDDVADESGESEPELDESDEETDDGT